MVLSSHQFVIVIKDVPGFSILGGLDLGKLLGDSASNELEGSTC